MGGIGTAVYPVAFLRTFHVRHLPHDEFQGHQLLPKTEHGAVAGVILFFTCGAAALGAISDGRHQ